MRRNPIPNPNRQPSYLGAIAFQMRQKRDLPMRVIADILNVGQPQISRLENGDCAMSWEQLKFIADTLEFGIDVLIVDRLAK